MMENNLNNDSLRLLRQKSEEQGFVTAEDIFRVFPNAALSSGAVENIVKLLSDNNIEFFDEEIEQTFASTENATEESIKKFNNDQNENDIVSIYLKEIKQVPLLNAEEEIDLAQRIRLGKEAAQLLSIERKNVTVNEEAQLRLLIEDGEEAHAHLITANTRLVVSIAKRYMNRGVAFLDLIQEGNLGLIKAIDKFDYTRGFRFSTYATWWIRQSITRALSDQGRTIRIPVHISEKIKTILKTSIRLEQKNGYTPTLAEISEELNIKEEKLKWVAEISQLPISLESPVNNENDEVDEIGDFIEDTTSPSPQQYTYDRMLTARIQDVLNLLPAREAQVIRMRYGLDNGKDHTLEEVGQRYGLTRERIRQIEKNAMNKLRHPCRSRKLRDYL